MTDEVFQAKVKGASQDKSPKEEEIAHAVLQSILLAGYRGGILILLDGKTARFYTETADPRDLRAAKMFEQAAVDGINHKGFFVVGDKE